MFGFGSPKSAEVSAETAEQPESGQRRKQKTRRCRRQRRSDSTRPDSPSSGEKAGERKNKPSAAGNFLSSWTGATQLNSNDSQSEQSNSSSPSISDDDSSHNHSSYDSDDDSGAGSNSSSCSSTNSQNSSLPDHGTESNVESPRSQSMGTSSRSSTQSPGSSSMPSSSMVSPESSLVSPESSRVTPTSPTGGDCADETSTSKEETRAETDSLQENGVSDSNQGSQKPTETQKSFLQLQIDEAGTELTLTVAAVEPLCVTSDTTPQSTEGSPEEVRLRHLVPPKIESMPERESNGKDTAENGGETNPAPAEAKGSDDVENGVVYDDDSDDDGDKDEEYDDFDDYLSDKQNHIFSGEEADDEMTMFSAGDSTFFGQSVGPAQNLKVSLKVDTLPDAVSEDESLLNSPVEGSPQAGAEPKDGPSVQPANTSSTLHSTSTHKQTNNETEEPALESDATTIESIGVSEVAHMDPGAVPQKTEEESVREIGLALERARGEYEMGSDLNRRYKTKQQPANDTMLSLTVSDSMSVQTPYFLNRKEIFHPSAAAAVEALLTPIETGSILSRASSKDRQDGVLLVQNSRGESIKESPSGQSTSHESPSAFQPPKEENSSEMAGQPATKLLLTGLINSNTERKLESLEKRMIDPSQTTADLLVAIASPEDANAIDLGFVVRRKNACGALKVMTNDPKKRLKLCWTVGVLPALTSVLTDSFDAKGLNFRRDKRIRYEYEAALNRAISALLNLSMPKENRMAVFHTPRLMQALIRLIQEQSESVCRGCTAILAFLAKSTENRLLMAQIPGFLDALVTVIRPKPPRVESGGQQLMRKTHPWVTQSDGKSSDDSYSESPSRRSEKTHSHASEDSQKTLKMAPSQTPIELFGYDETADAMLRSARNNVFALVSHLSKEKDNAYLFARDTVLLQTMIQITTFHESPAHVLAMKFLANLTRHRQNTKLLVFNERDAVPAIIKAANAEHEETRLYACLALQNLAQDKSCRQELAGADGLVTVLCRRGRYAESEEERLAAIAAIKNLCDEPANLIPLTNTPECIATLMHVAHGREDGVTEMMQYRACDALATLSHWLRKIATSGKALDTTQKGELLVQDQGLFIPSLRVVTWNQWQ